MAITQPTPPPNPTASEQPVDPVDTFTTTASTNDGTNGDVQIQPVIDPEETVTELRVPTTSEAATDPRPILRLHESTDIGLIIGIVVIVIVVIAVVVSVVAIMAVLFKRRFGKFTTVTVPTTANQAYGLSIHHNEGVGEIIYNDLSPKTDVDNTIKAKQNDAYATNTHVNAEENQAYGTNIDGIITEGNKAYVTCANVDMIATEGNRAYATNIITEESQAHATNITTEKNASYEQVITDETVDKYNYVYN